jgi:uncharacterized protein (TIRG00374 family)
VKRALSSILKLSVSVLLLYYLLHNAQLDEFSDIVTTASALYLGAAVLFFVLSNGLGALQWHVLLRAQQLPIRFRQSLVLYWIGVFFNNVLLGNIGGDALRIYDIRRLTGEGTGGAAATFMDRFIGLFSTCTLALVAYLAVPQVREAKPVMMLFPIWLALIGLLCMGLSQHVGWFIERLARRLLPEPVAKLLGDLRLRIVVYRHRLGLLLAVWLVPLGVQACRILVYWMAGLAVGMEVSLVFYIAFQPVAAIVAALPISIGGLGVRENVLVELFGHVGTPSSLAFAMSLLGYAAGIVASLLGGIAFVLRRIERQA